MKKPIKSVKAAKEKAVEYKTEKTEEKVAEQEKPSTEQTLEIQVWGDYVNQQIEEAMRAGQFDNLKGKGKPQDLRRNPFVPEDQELAFNLLSNNDLVPGWISDRTAILKAIEQWRENAQRLTLPYHHQLQTAMSEQRRAQLQERWTAQVQRWETELRDLNKRINVVNLQQPIAHLEIFKLLIDEELRRVGMKRVL
ncbi:MAG: DnaJ family domain-containing protein [Caldilineaceae bacterium]